MTEAGGTAADVVASATKIDGGRGVPSIVAAPSRRIDGQGVPPRRETPPGRGASMNAPGRATASVLFCDVSARHPIADIRLWGELAADTVADLGAELAALIRTGHHLLTVDACRLSHVSPACVGVLNRAATDLLPLGGDLVLTGLSSADVDRLRTAGLHGAIRLTVAHDVGAVPPDERQGRPSQGQRRASP